MPATPSPSVSAQSNTDSAPDYWADGKFLIVRDGSTLPQRCIICNADADKSKTLTFSRPNHGGLIGAVAQIAADSIFEVRYTGPITTTVYLCSRHRSRRMQISLAALGLALLFALGGWYAQIYTGRPDTPAAFGSFMMAAICGVLAIFVWLLNPWLSPRKFMDRLVELKGSGQSFRNSLPPRPRN